MSMQGFELGGPERLYESIIFRQPDCEPTLS